MVFQERKMIAYVFVYNQNRHMSVGGGLSAPNPRLFGIMRL